MLRPPLHSWLLSFHECFHRGKFVAKNWVIFNTACYLVDIYLLENISRHDMYKLLKSLYLSFGESGRIKNFGRISDFGDWVSEKTLFLYCACNWFSQTKAALIYDSVELIGKGLHALETSQIQRIDLKSLNCKKQNTWQHGSLVLDALRKVSLKIYTLLRTRCSKIFMNSES